MTTYFPPYRGLGENIKVELDLTNYATKDDVKNITHVNVSSFVSKTNLAALKTEVDKIDTDKLKTVPGDLAKLTNVVKNDVVQKTDYNAKVSNIETQIQGAVKNTLDNLADIKVLKTKTVDATTFATKTCLGAKEKKIPDISGLATKTSLDAYLQTTTFNSKIREVENKISTNDALTKVASTKISNIEANLDGFRKSDISGYAKKTELADETTKIKNDFATNASVDSKINDLKAQHIADKVKKVDDRAKKNSSDILGFENRLKPKEDTVDENQRGLSFNRGFFYYIDHYYLVYGWKMSSFNFSSGKISV